MEAWLDAEAPGALAICHHGCAIYSSLVVTGPSRGTVWDGDDDLWPLEKGFLQWYRWWADGALRRVRALPLVARLRVGMTAGEAMEAIPGAWKEAPARDGLTTYLHPPAAVPAMLVLDGDRRVVSVYAPDTL